MRNQCKCCGEQVGDPNGPLVAKHYCDQVRLAELYGGSPRTYTNTIGHVEGWAEYKLCSVCGSPAVVAGKATGMLDTHWCRQHVGKRVANAKKSVNPFGVFVAACYSR